jgi:hypothetical protein
MRFVRRNRYFLIFAVLLLFCGVMVLRQMEANRWAHTELREAFILIAAKGIYKAEGQHLFQRLLADLQTLSNQALLEDFQRTSMLVDPAKQDPENPLWKYYWTVSNELEKRARGRLAHALKLAHER